MMEAKDNQFGMQRANAALRHEYESGVLDFAEYVLIISENFPQLISMNIPDEPAYIPEPVGPEMAVGGWFRTNEYYPELRSIVGALKGTGVTVGPEQGLDFLSMFDLDGVHFVDIDAYTPILSTSYMEIGTRLHRILGRYPTVAEYVYMFAEHNREAAIQLLSRPAPRRNYSSEDLAWFRDHAISDVHLSEKIQYYGEGTWVSSDAVLAQTIRKYESGFIRFSKGDIFGSVLPDIGREIAGRGSYVSLIYTSNVNAVGQMDTIAKLRALPTTEDTLVLFSGYPGMGQYREVIPPEGYSRILDWSFFMFRLHAVDSWPTVQVQETYHEVKNGIYLHDSMIDIRKTKYE